MTTPDARSEQSLDQGRVCLLVTGAPGAGKSTVTRLLATALTRSALIGGDVVHGFVVGGYVWPLGDPPDEAARQVALCNDNLCALADNITTAGFTPVIDWVVPDGAQLEVYRRALGPRLRLVVLDPGTSTCRQRNDHRDPVEQFAFDGYAELRDSMWAGFGSQGWWFDTSALTPEATVDRILAEADVRARVR